MRILRRRSMTCGLHTASLDCTRLFIFPCGESRVGSAVPVVLPPCAFFRTRDYGRSRRPAFPAPLSDKGTMRLHNSGENRAAGMSTYIVARSEATEAIHFSPRGEMDCFASLAMTVGGILEAVRSALPPHRASPMLQRRPHAARQAEAIDRGRAAERLEAVQLDAAPLEAALLKNVARGRVGHAGASEQLLAVKLLEEIVDRRARGLGAKTLAPMIDAKPVAELWRV